MKKSNIKVNTKNILFLIFSLVFVNGNIIAQNFTNAHIIAKQINKLAIKCSNGNTKSCEKLIKIAKSNKSSSTRTTAVNKLSDQNLLAEIAKNDTSEFVRIAAVAKITDQSILIVIAKNDKEGTVREDAKGWHLTKNIKLTPFDVTKHIEKGGVVLLRM